MPELPVDLAVLPEYAYFISPERAMAAKRGPADLARKIDAPVVFGAVLGDYGEADFQNVAVVLDARGELPGTFTKQRPLPLFHDGVQGTERPVFPLEQGTLGVAICYDCDAPGVAASLVRQGATVLVVPTYDAKLWGELQHAHHELLMRLRAVENNRWLVRATSSGRSEAIDPHGMPSKAGLEFRAAGFVVVGFRHLDRVVPGSYLDFLGTAAAGLSVALVLVQVIQRRRQGTGSC